MTNLILTPGILKQFYPLNTLTHGEVDLILKQTKVEELNKRNIIFSEGDDDTDVIYLLSGTLLLKADNGAEFLLDADSEQAFYPIANFKPRNFSAEVHSDTVSIARLPTKSVESFIFRLEKDELWMFGSIPIKKEERRLDSEWMMALKKTPLFQKLQDEYLKQIFHVMEEKTYGSGANVISEGDPGDYFYLIKEGVCAVFRQKNGKEIELAKLRVTDSFGEDSLLSGNPRNATVRMVTDGTLMRISQEDFQKFMFQPNVKWTIPEQAKILLQTGARLIDVRKNRDKGGTHENAKYIPMFMLRNQLKRLDKDKIYLILCNSKQDGAIASYLFSKFGLDGYPFLGDSIPK